MAGLQRTRGCASHQTEVWRIAPAREGPRNASNNKAHEPTSGRSTHYGSAHLIQVFRDIGHIFSSLRPFIGGSVFLVALAPPRAGLVIPRVMPFPIPNKQINRQDKPLITTSLRRFQIALG